MYRTLVFSALVALGASIDCDVLVLGGSTASVAAAVAAGQLGARVCLTEPTDWVGGQLTSSAVSAIDYGEDNSPDGPTAANLPKSFLELSDLFSESTGRCWVSERCYEPQVLVKYLDGLLQPVRVLRNTVVVNVTRDDASGRVVSVTAVQRTARGNTTGWEHRLSDVLDDWYSPLDSALFDKTVIHFEVAPSSVVIEATEFGDVLVLTDSFGQGIETPAEDSDSYLDVCGQSATVDFYLFSWNESFCPFTAEGGCPQQECDFGIYPGLTRDSIWTYRRSRSSADAFGPDQVSLQNIDSMDEPSYLFLPAADVREQAKTGWRGGINLTALALAERRSLGYMAWYAALFKNETGSVCVAREQVGTQTGLAKMPYLRETRRANRGTGGFRLTREMLASGVAFGDMIGIGTYPVDRHMAVCSSTLPDYISNNTIAPYYLPFRALTVESVPNVLVAGKALAQSWLANAPTRLHPEEWVTGSAAGAAAALWVRNGWTSSRHVDVEQLQDMLSRMGQPMEWAKV
jgi:hypothetical protein